MECCPQHTELWLALARLSSHEEARKILNKAGSESPSIIANPDPACSSSARDTILNNDPIPPLILTLERLWKAREEIPADPTIWFAAAKLEEAQGNAGLAATIINRAPAKLRKNNGVVSRDEWLKVRWPEC